MKAREVLELLESPPPTETDIDEHLSILTALSIITVLPLNSALEDSLLCCSIFISLEHDKTEHCRDELRRILGPSIYAHLVTFIAYIKTCHVWMEAHPDIAPAADKRVQDHFSALLEEEPDLTDFFRNYWERVRHERQSRAEHLSALAERQRAEASLRESENRFKTFMNNSPVMAFMKDEEGRYIYVNEPLERVFKVKLAELQGKTDFDCLPEETAKQVRENDVGVLATGKTAEVLETVPTPDGFLHYWLVLKFIVNDLRGRRLLGGVAVDITERMQAEAEIKASLQEKDLLLKEVNHRVKNNLQIIDSLFKHQIRHTKNKKTIEILKECQNRVNAITLLHKKIEQAKYFAKIDFSGYIRSLLSSLFDTYNIDTKITILEINIDDVFLENGIALPCGLIINELVSNSLKHAFPANEKGVIQISFYSSNNDSFTLVVKDDGIGLPKEFDLQTLQTLGLKLVKSLVRQLGGAIEINLSGETKFLITFPAVKNDIIN